MEPQLKFCALMRIVYYSYNAHLLRLESEHTCASAIYYQMDSVKHCKSKHAINLKCDPTILDAGDLILLYILLKLQTVVCITEN